MMDLLNTFTYEQIILFVIILIIAIKEGWSLIDFFIGKYKSKKENIIEENQKEQLIEKTLLDINESLKEQKLTFSVFSSDFEAYKKRISKIMNAYDNKLSTLIDSDKDDIKGFIVQQYHLFVEEKKWIDDFSLDVLEKRYAHYKQEGGNSYIESLMTEIRHLPKRPPKN